MGKINFICLSCRGSFTRKFSANRHNDSQHGGKGQICRVGDDLISRKPAIISKVAGFPGRMNSFSVQKSSQPTQCEDRLMESRRPFNTDGRQTDRPYRGFLAQIASYAVNPAGDRSNVTFLHKFNKIRELERLISLVASPQEAKDLLWAAHLIEDTDFLDEIVVGFQNIAGNRRSSNGFSFNSN